MADETNDTPEDGEAEPAAETRSVAPFIDDDEDEEVVAEAGEADEDDDEVDDADEDAEEPEAESDPDEDEDDEDDEAAAASRKAKADAVVAQRTVQRRTVTSRRVTPKAGAKPAAAARASKATSKARDAKKTETVIRTTAPPTRLDKGPSPWWVPAIMFGLLIVGALVIMANYMGAFGTASNVYLVVGLGFILGGIVAATQYR